MDIRVELLDFYTPGSSIEILVPVTWPDMVRSATTVGRDVWWTQAGVPADLLLYERIWRASMLWSTLASSLHPHPDGYQPIRRTSAYDSLDRSEKGAISFFLGQATAKYIAEELFGCVVFAHLDSTLALLGLPVHGTRPDFVGRCADGRSLVVEVKGRSGALGGALSTVKQQLAGLPGPVGTTDLRYGHASYFAGSELRVRLLDPPAADVDAIPIRPLALAHYGPLVALLEGGEVVRRDGGQVREVVVPGIGVEIGLEEEVIADVAALQEEAISGEEFVERIIGRQNGALELPRRRSIAIDEELRDLAESSVQLEQATGQAQPRQIRLDREALAAEVDERRAVIGPDGFFVELSDMWSQERMTREGL